MSLVSFAKSELEASAFFDKDSDYDGALGPAVLAARAGLIQRGLTA